MHAFNFDHVDPSWMDCLTEGLLAIDPNYVKHLDQNKHWLPGPQKIFNAFSLPLDRVKYVLFGESPYPRKESANGFAFWDASVHGLWASTGLNKKVNRATSLRNFLKMLLTAEGYLKKNDCSQMAIAKLDKKNLVQTNDELFSNLLSKGFLLLNTTLVLQKTSKHRDAAAWSPFIQILLNCLLKEKPKIKFLLFGRLAQKIERLLNTSDINALYAEHPYNHSFIHNPKIQAFFGPLQLLQAKI